MSDENEFIEITGHGGEGYCAWVTFRVNFDKIPPVPGFSPEDGEAILARIKEAMHEHRREQLRRLAEVMKPRDLFP